MKSNPINDLETYKEAFEIERIGNEAINEVIRKNKENERLVQYRNSL